MFPPKPFDNFSSEGGCSEGLDVFILFYYIVNKWGHNIRHNNIPPKRHRLALLINRRENMHGLEADETCGAPRQDVGASSISP